MDYLKRAREVMEQEIDGLKAVQANLDENFIKLVELCQKIIAQHGKIVITGVGKSGHIGQKLSATLASTGSPSVFMHPVEAMHGDLGILDKQDMLMALSYSGETDELLQVLPAAKRFDIPIIALTSDPNSSLSKYSVLSLNLKVPSEACPFNLAPTTSTTATLAFGDALALVLMEDRKFTKEDYSKLHPAGAIGRSITLQIKDIMRPPERAPMVTADTTVKEALLQMTKCRSGSVMIVDADGKLKGVFTDGDFRRHIQEDLDVMHTEIKEVMTSDPIHLKDSDMGIAILKLLEKREIDDIPVVDENGKAVGLVDIQDLPKFKLM